MKNTVPVRVLLAVIFLAAIPTIAFSAETERSSEDLLRAGISAFQDSRFEVAADLFMKIVAMDESTDREAEGYFWLAKSYMALGAIDQAAQHLEYFIHHFPDHRYQSEAYYQRGRVFYLQGEYEQSIRSFADFIDEYPDSPFIANALYWTGECLFSLGRLDEARSLFTTVIQEHSASFRSEAARYRLSVLDLKEREETLLNLLRISHQELLHTIQDHERREQEYEESVHEYRRRLRDSAPDEVQHEMRELQQQIEDLQQANDELQQRITELQDSVPTNQGAQ